MSVRISDALYALNPLAQWSCGDTYDSIVWMSPDIPMPTEEQVQVELARLQQLYIKNEYQRRRATAYPTWEEQMDVLYHQGYDGWKAVIQQVKNTYPKPTE